MADQPHAMLARNPGKIQTGHSSNPATMKAQVRKSNRSKKAAKVRRGSRAAKPVICRSGVGCVTCNQEAAEERAKLWTKRKLSDILALLSLGTQPDHVARKVNRRKREAGFTEPAALPVADPVSDEHPGSVGVAPSELPERIYDLEVLQESDRSFLLGVATAQAELEARVAVAESRLDSLLHDQPQVPNIDKSSVAASGAGGTATPLDEVSGDLPAYLPGYYDPALPKECAESVPSVTGPLKGEGAAGVPLGEEAPDPGREGFSLNPEWTAARLLGLNRPSRVPEPSRFSRLVRQCVAQARRVLHAAARAVAEL